MADRCPWCRYAEGGCSGDECEFRTLPYEKGAILARLKKERIRIEVVRGRIVAMRYAAKEEMEEDVRQMFDVISAMQTMIDRLVADFGMTAEGVRGKIGAVQKIGKAELALALARMKRLKKRKG